LYPDEPENALHVVEPFEIPDWWPKMFIGDWGFTAMTYIGFYAISPQKRLYLYRELYWLKTKIEDWAPVIKDFVVREQPKIVKFCKSIGQERGQEHTIQQQIESALEMPVELTTNSPGSRISGKILLHEYLRWKQKPQVPLNDLPVYSEEYAMWLLRNKGMMDYKAYHSLFDPPEDETNIPKLQIFRCEEENHVGHPDCCPLMIEAIKACIYAKPKDDKPAEDVTEFDGDDPYDDIRYACDSAERYFDEASEEFKKIQKQASISAALSNTHDFTAYYRNMQMLNSQQQSVQAVRRFSRRRK
jgi:hypothetical protein